MQLWTEGVQYSAGVVGFYGLRQGLFAKVGEAFELFLVDLFDNGVFYWREHRLLAGEVLVKIVDVSFGFLWLEKKKMPCEWFRRFRAVMHKNKLVQTQSWVHILDRITLGQPPILI